jgi:glycosyltransferase involved in cell wall biosynthesis
LIVATNSKTKSGEIHVVVISRSYAHANEDVLLDHHIADKMGLILNTAKVANGAVVQRHDSATQNDAIAKSATLADRRQVADEHPISQMRVGIDHGVSANNRAGTDGHGAKRAFNRTRRRPVRDRRSPDYGAVEDDRFVPDVDAWVDGHALTDKSIRAHHYIAGNVRAGRMGAEHHIRERSDYLIHLLCAPVYRDRAGDYLLSWCCRDTRGPVANIVNVSAGDQQFTKVGSGQGQLWMRSVGSSLKLVSVVVPVYFNEASLPDLLRRLQAVAESLKPIEMEFVFVDDGSGDTSFRVLVGLSVTDNRLKVLRLSRNFGSNAAILAGLTYATGDAVAVIAADLQDPPELIPKMVHAWQEGAEVVLGARSTRADPWLSKGLASIFNRLFKQVVFRDWPKDGCDFILVSRRVASTLARMAEKNSYIFGQAMWLGFTRQTLFYERSEREHGRSRWTTLKKVKYFIDAFTAFSYLPVRLASLLGFVLAFAGFSYAAIVAILRLANIIQEPGFAGLVVAVFVTSGVQLVVLGLIGEYLWRVLEETRQRPAFVVAEAINVKVSEGAWQAGADTSFASCTQDEAIS